MTTEYSKPVDPVTTSTGDYMPLILEDPVTTTGDYMPPILAEV